MQSDELIWSVINHQFCSYKVKTDSQNFCRNEYNVTGFCNRQSCPLANSRYATVREEEGTLYLYMKTIERAHMPKHLWEKVRLSQNYAKALEQIDSNLMYWPDFLKHKCKQRTTKITQYLIKLRKLRTRENGKMVPVKQKIDRREARREAKALTAARLEKTLEKELVSRLKSKAYGDAPLNVNEEVWKAVLAQDGMADDLDADVDVDSDEEEVEKEHEFVEDFEESDVEDLEDFSDLGSLDEDDQSDEDSEDGSDEEPEEAPKKAGGKRKGKQAPAGRAAKKGRVEIEYEMESEGPLKSRSVAW